MDFGSWILQFFEIFLESIDESMRVKKNSISEIVAFFTFDNYNDFSHSDDIYNLLYGDYFREF